MSPQKPLHRMFEAVPPRYDLINHLFTLGMDTRWRQKAIEHCISNSPGTILDVCCGTADLSIGLIKKTNGNTEVFGLDYSQPMLDIASQKVALIRGGKYLSLIHGDASRLPFKNSSIDCVGISFAFRNMTYKNPLSTAHLKEIHRVLTETGKYVIVESSQPGSKTIRWIFRQYLRFFVYWTGYTISKNKAAYRYLSESAANFYSPFEVKEMLINAGFREVIYYALFFGAAGIHVAFK